MFAARLWSWAARSESAHSAVVLFLLTHEDAQRGVYSPFNAAAVRGLVFAGGTERWERVLVVAVFGDESRAGRMRG